MILAAGFGTRLGDLTRLRPKPMLPVLDVPLVRWSVLWLRHHGIRDIVINLHHMGEQIEDELGDGRELDVSIRYSREEGMILGTGGGLRHARAMLDPGDGEPIVVVNGKILTAVSLSHVLEEHRRRSAEATMVLRPDPRAEQWGSLQVARDGRVVRLLQATPSVRVPEPTGPALMFTGIAVLEPRFLDRIPPEGEQCVVRTAYRSLFDEGRDLQGWVTEDYWWEHSTPERYLQGVFNVLEGRVSLPFAPHGTSGVHPSASIDPTARIVDPVWVGPGASIGAGATVGPLAQIGAGARVAAGVEVQRSIVWGGARVERSTVDAVVSG